MEQIRLEKYAKKTISLFVIDRKMKKLIHSTKDIVTKLVATVGMRAERITKVKGYNTLAALFKSEEDCIKLSKTKIITPDYILRMEYLGRRRTTISIFKAPGVVPGEYLAAYLLQFGDITEVNVDQYNGVWFFDILLNKETYYKIPYYIEAENEKLPIVVAGRRPACWICGEVGHLTYTCPKKQKAPRNPQNWVLSHLELDAQVGSKMPETVEKSNKDYPPKISPDEFDSVCNTEAASPEKKMSRNLYLPRSHHIDPTQSL